MPEASERNRKGLCEIMKVLPLLLKKEFNVGISVEKRSKVKVSLLVLKKRMAAVE